MSANNKKYCLGFFDKLVDKYNNSYHYSIEKKPTVVDYFSLTENIEKSLKHLNLKFVIKSRLLCKTICFVKVTKKIGQKKYLLLILC